MKKQNFVETKKKPFFESYKIPKLENIVFGILLFYLLAITGEFLLKLEGKADLIQRFFDYDFEIYANDSLYGVYKLVFFIFVPPIFFIYVSLVYILLVISDFLINDKFKEFFSNKYLGFKDIFNVAFFIASLIPILMSVILLEMFVLLNIFYQLWSYMFYQITSGDYRKKFRVKPLKKNIWTLFIKTTERITAITLFFSSEYIFLNISREVLWFAFISLASIVLAILFFIVSLLALVGWYELKKITGAKI